MISPVKINIFTFMRVMVNELMLMKSSSYNIPLHHVATVLHYACIS